MSQQTLTSAVPLAILRKLRMVRQRKTLVHAASAVVAAIAVLLAAMGVAMLIDWLATLYDSPWRLVLTGGALSAAALTVVGWLAVAWRRALGLDRIASDVDCQIPQLQERWTTLARLGAGPSQPEVAHPAMLRRVAAEAASWEPQVHPEQVVSLSTLLRAMLVLTSVTAVLAIAVVLDSDQTLVLVRRFWWPGSSISATQLVNVPGNTVVGRGEPVALAAVVKGTQVEHATLFLRSNGGREQSIDLVAHGQDPIEFSHRERTVDEPFAYRFRAGDGQTDWCMVDVADRPEIDALRVTVTPPAYTRRPAKAFDTLPRRISAMQLSQFELAVRPTVPVQTVELRLTGDKRVPLVAAADGWFRWKTTLNEGFALVPVLTEPHGLTNRRAPECEVSVYRDKPPAVKILTPEDQMAVRGDDMIQITFTANDDVGIGSAELLVYDDAPGGQPLPIATIPIPLADAAGAQSIQETVDLDLRKFTLNDGVELSYEIRVRENRGQPVTDPATRPPADSVASNARLAAREPKSRLKPTPPSHNNSPATTPNSTANAAPPGPKNVAADERRPAGNSLASQNPVESRPANESPQNQMPLGTEAMTANRPMGRSDARRSDDQKLSAAPRTATSGRQGLASERKPRDDQRTATTQNADRSKHNGAGAANSQISTVDAGKRQTGKSEPPSPGSEMASASPQDSPSSPVDPPPEDSMARRALDVTQSSTSQRMRLTVNRWAGSFSGQQREKTEMAILPDLEALDHALAKAQRTARSVLDRLATDANWRETYDREVTSAEKSTVDAQHVIDQLAQRSKGTPYAFVGLQVVDIGLAHIEPARNGFWKALESNGDDRITSVRDAWQHVTGARESVAELRGQFERTRREFKLAESVQRVKKMYQVYLENSLALLQIQDDDPNRYNRKLAEFDLDDEYLKRLQKVLEMRNDLRAELARILAEDPRLLRRFMDSLRNRSNDMREELANLISQQTDLNREVEAWASAEEADRPRLAQVLLLRQVHDTAKISSSAGELQSRYQSWLPLNREVMDADLSAATKRTQEVATAAGELNARAGDFISIPERPGAVATPSPSEKTGPETPADPQSASNSVQSLDKMLAHAQHLYDALTQLEVALRQIAARDDDGETAAFAASRLVETRRLITDISAWIRQVRAHRTGNFPGAADVEQYRLAMRTDELAGKLGTIEQTISGLLQRTDGSLPQPVAEKAREFLATLDREASPNQLAAVYALHNNQLHRATERQQLAGVALSKAERLYDEMMKLAIAELDKLPVQDPISNLLDDPTLDELLAQLEQELPLAELLGIPTRPSNLRIIGDWMQPGGNNATNTGGGGLVMTQVRQDERRARNRLDQAYRRAIARALKETTPRQKLENPKSMKLSDWNRLVSKLGDDLRQGRDKAPPEQYRRAIEQYFAQISRVAAENEESSP